MSLMDRFTHAILPADRYDGWICDMYDPEADETMIGHHTLAEYRAAKKEELRVLPYDEVQALDKARQEEMRTPATAIDAERHSYLLEVLPPCRWHSHRGISLFHISERLTGRLVTWAADAGRGRYFEFIDYDNAASDDLVAKVEAAMKETA